MPLMGNQPFPWGRVNKNNIMKIPIINGSFDSRDAIDILTQLFHAKIRFHEGKILHTQQEEDIKMREKRIKELQQALNEIRENLSPLESKIVLHGEVDIAIHQP